MQTIKVFQRCKEDERNHLYPCTVRRCKHPWTVRWRDLTGKQIERSFKTEKLANDARIEIEAAHKDHVDLDPDRPQTPLVKVYEEFILAGSRVASSDRSLETSLRLHISPFFGKRPIGSIRQMDLKMWLKWMNERYAESTVINRYEMLASVFTFAMVNDYIKKNPCVGLKTGRTAVKRRVKKKIRIPSIVEAQKISDSLPAQYRLLVWLMCGLGLRIGEAMAVSLGQFNFEANVIYVDRQVAQDGENDEPRTKWLATITKGKGQAAQIRHLKWRDSDEGRPVPMPLLISQKVRDHIREFGLYRVEEGPNRMAGDYLFSNKTRTNILTYSVMEQNWVAAVKTSGVARKITPQWLRHFFASAALSEGVPVNEVAEWLGHRDPKVTYLTYAHIMPDAPERLRSVMDGVLSQAIELDLPLEFDAGGEAA
ncbi:tyrosine-type recombinase/integrase [Kitasatospora purpeofusca]|uniref:tyrosine-type recombinase/integrase n=1 Tax=Kitasatospora purpeofusca TaxID=67352 RepID=UPI003699DEE6